MALLYKSCFATCNVAHSSQLARSHLYLAKGVLSVSTLSIDNEIGAVKSIGSLQTKSEEVTLIAVNS